MVELTRVVCGDIDAWSVVCVCVCELKLIRREGSGGIGRAGSGGIGRAGSGGLRLWLGIFLGLQQYVLVGKIFETSSPLCF